MTKDTATTKAIDASSGEAIFTQPKTLKETPKGQPNEIEGLGGRVLDFNGSTYPNREKDLQDSKGYLPENVDNVRRARANGSRMPASAIGLTIDGELVEDQ